MIKIQYPFSAPATVVLVFEQMFPLCTPWDNLIAMMKSYRQDDDTGLQLSPRSCQIKS